MPWCLRVAAWVVVFVVGAHGASFGTNHAVADDPLHVRIDRHIDAALDYDPAPTASDAEFLRRVYLDLTGMIPPVDVAREFLADKTPSKRERVIDRLLASPEYARRMQFVFDVILMERRAGNSVPANQWQEYLRKSFEDNKPYNQLAREILAADGTENRPAVKFYLDRAGETNTLTRDVGRLFLGMDLQCAQCHDHPIIEGYFQRDYYGIYAFLNRGFVFSDPKAKSQYFAEKAEGEVSYKSVFDPKVNEQNFRPRLRGGAAVEEPKFPKGDEYFVKPAKNVRPVPRFSRRGQLAATATDGSNAMFNSNIVNRLWYLMMGRGLVHPPGLQHEDNPASHPELLKELAAELVAMKFDVRRFLREIAMTQAYQRSSEIPAGMSEDQAAPQRYAVAPLRPLSPEQLAWSLLEATGFCEPIRTAEAARLDADPRMRELYASSERGRYVRAQSIEKAVHSKLQANTAQFVSLFGGSPGEPEQDFQATVHQSLFVTNGATIRGWATALGGRLAKIEDPRAAADALYMAILTRAATEEERLDVVEYLLRQSTNRAAGIADIAWALAASTEFRFNH